MVIPEPSLAVSVVTGFLGSGKTTLLRRLLAHPRLADTAVIVNEFGEIGLDHQLMEAAGQPTLLLDSGCICCSLNGGIADTLRELRRARRAGSIPAFRRVLIETTGLADPVPVLQGLLDHDTGRLGFHLHRTITMIDCANGWNTLDRHDVAVTQVALADDLLLSKADIAATDTIGRLEERLDTINSRARRARVHNGEVPSWLAESLDPTGIGTASRSLFAAFGDGGSSTGQQLSHDRIVTASVRLSKPVCLDRLNAWLAEAIARYGSDLLRVKGIVNVKGRQRPLVIHGVQNVFHPLVELDEWPQEDRASRLVMILHDVEPDSLVTSLKRALETDEDTTFEQ